MLTPNSYLLCNFQFVTWFCFPYLILMRERGSFEVSQPLHFRKPTTIIESFPLPGSGTGGTKSCPKHTAMPLGPFPKMSSRPNRLNIEFRDAGQGFLLPPAKRRQQVKMLPLGFSRLALSGHDQLCPTVTCNDCNIDLCMCRRSTAASTPSMLS